MKQIYFILALILSFLGIAAYHKGFEPEGILFMINGGVGYIKFLED